MSDERRKPLAVVLAEQRLLIMYDPNFVGNYRERPAVLLPEPSTLLRGGDHYQKEVLRWVLAF